MSEIQYSDVVSGGTNIEIYDQYNIVVGICHMVAFSVKDRIGRLALRENITLDLNDIDLKILVTGLSIGEGSKYQIIRNIVFDKNQESFIDKQLTFTFDKVSDWVTTKGF